MGCQGLLPGTACGPCDRKGPLVTPRALPWLSPSNQDGFLFAWADSIARAFPDGVETTSGQLHLVLLSWLPKKRQCPRQAVLGFFFKKKVMLVDLD